MEALFYQCERSVTSGELNDSPLFKIGKMQINGMLICVYLWAAMYVLWLIWAVRTKPTRSKEGLGSRMSHRLPVIVAYVLMFAPYTAKGWLQSQVFPGRFWVQLLGVSFTALGLLFAVWARLYLGGNWSSAVMVKVGHELVRSGPYRWVRHPIYSGLVFAMLGTAIANQEVRGVIALVLAFIGFTIKSRIEERAMSSTFGVEYEEYSRNTGGILPRL
jgi:protein-S-isoprenylcysteine O-methyltransferase Ste14